MGPKNRILVVDKDKEILRLISYILKEEYDVMLAVDCDTAIYSLETFQPDLIILDIKMPKLNGFQILDLIRERSSIPIIMLTEKVDKTSLYDAITLGVDDFVQMPLYSHEFATRVRAKLRRSKSVWKNDN